MILFIRLYSTWLYRNWCWVRVAYYLISSCSEIVFKPPYRWYFCLVSTCLCITCWMVYFQIDKNYNNQLTILSCSRLFKTNLKKKEHQNIIHLNWATTDNGIWKKSLPERHVDWNLLHFCMVFWIFNQNVFFTVCLSIFLCINTLILLFLHK